MAALSWGNMKRASLDHAGLLIFNGFIYELRVRSGHMALDPHTDFEG